MKIRTVDVTLDDGDLRVMASALRLFHRTCVMSTDNEERVRALVRIAEQGDDTVGKPYAEVIGDGRSAQVAGDGGSSI